MRILQQGFRVYVDCNDPDRTIAFYEVTADLTARHLDGAVAEYFEAVS
jgi:hypothetical protein